jgi:hypothetical protein
VLERICMLAYNQGSVLCLLQDSFVIAQQVAKGLPMVMGKCPLILSERGVELVYCS